MKAQFEDVGILKAGKEVKQDGLRVGTVSDVSLVDGVAQVTLRLDGDVDVYKDATAYVGNFSALGKKYVGFDPGTAASGELGNDVIAVSSTKDSNSLEDVLSTFDPKTRKAVRGAVAELATGTAGHSDDLRDVLEASPDLLADLETVMEATGSSEAEVSALLMSGDRLVNRFNGRQRQIDGLVRNLDKTVAAVGVDEGEPLERTVGKLPEALATTRKGLDDVEAPLDDAAVALRQLKPGARALGKGTPDLRGFLRESPPTLDKLPRVSGTASPAIASLTDTVADARPVVRPLASSLEDSAYFLRLFAPYIPDTGRFFSQHDLLSGTLEGDDNKHYFAAQLTGLGLFSVAGVPDPLYRSEPYPCPGTAWNKSTRTNCSGGAKR
ncbi:MlaD family protein [Nocardioides sp. NPDC051685]|uniref:MlaD family protein n=1 Tax=Nocardioides sp. NPDC051685 TaxID=3364334 RepID=UPI0037AA6920